MRNNFEKQISKELKDLKCKFEYESIRVPYTLYYIPDFIVTTRAGKTIYIETKGYLRPTDKTKLKRVKEQHPDMDIRIVFYENRKASIKWAEKNKFPYALKSVPKEWFK